MVVGSLTYLVANLFAASRNCGRSALTLAVEIRRLRGFPNKLLVSEYFNLKLYEKSRDEQATFLGSYWDGPINYIVASPSWFSIVRDKAVFQSFMSSLGYRVPEVVAVYSTEGRNLPGLVTLDSEEALAKWLRDLEQPVFAKPLGADVGVGAMYLEPLGDGSFDITPGGKVTLQTLVRTICDLPYGGYLFQTALFNGPDVSDVLGRYLCTVRICVLRGKATSTIHRAFLKIRVGDARNDNWDLGRSGNAIGVLDSETGTVQTVFTGAYPDIHRSVNHPETGERIVSWTFPRWRELTELCRAASREIKGLGIQHWDVALTDDGPCLIEVNEDGSLLALQGCGYEGFLDGSLKRFLAESGLDLSAPATQAYADKSGDLVTQIFARDNALMGRGDFKNPVTNMK